MMRDHRLPFVLCCYRLYNNKRNLVHACAQKSASSPPHIKQQQDIRQRSNKQQWLQLALDTQPRIYNVDGILR